MNTFSIFLKASLLGLTFLFANSSTVLTESSKDIDMVTIYDQGTVKYRVESRITSNIVDSYYYAENNLFQIIASSNFTFIQVTDNNNDLVYQLPLNTKTLHLDMQDFEAGKHNVHFMMEGENEMIYSQLEKK